MAYIHNPPCNQQTRPLKNCWLEDERIVLGLGLLGVCCFFSREHGPQCSCQRSHSLFLDSFGSWEDDVVNREIRHFSTTVDASEILHQLRLVVYPITVFTMFYTSQVVQNFFHQQYIVAFTETPSHPFHGHDFVFEKRVKWVSF